MRNVYATVNLHISPKEKASMADLLKQLIRSRGEDPAKYLKRRVIAGRDIVSQDDEAEIYARAVWEMLRKELVDSLSESPSDTLSI